MKITILLILIFLFNSTSFSQNGWVQQQSGITQPLTCVCFITNNQGWAVGHSGRILYTSNGGSNWNIQAIVTDAALRTVNFANSNTGFTAGGTNKLYKTTNGGIKWDTLTNGSVYNWVQIFFCTDIVGFAIGYGSSFNGRYILKTINGGNSWTNSLYVDSSNIGFSSIYFTDQNTGWVGGSLLLKTTNSGINWFTQPTGSSDNWATVFFTSQNTGWLASGTSSIVKTTNSGNAWLPQYSGTNSSLNSSFFVNANTGWIVGYTGTIINTINGGINWNSQTSGVNANLTSLYFTSVNTGYIVGDSGKILKTTNGGISIGITQIGSEIPKSFSISQNYPNPFNPQTKIKFELPSLSRSKSSIPVKLVIFDLLGREVTTLVNEELKPGTYEADWDGSNYSSGVYFYKIITEGFVETKKMVLMK